MDSGLPVPYDGLQSQAFGFYCKSLLDSESHKIKFLGFGIRNPSHGAIKSLRLFFLLLFSSIGSPDSIYVCSAQYHKIFILFVQRLSSVMFLFVSTERPRAFRSGVPYL